MTTLAVPAPLADICDVPIPVIQAGCIVPDAASGIAGVASSSVLGSIGDSFARGAETVLDAVFELITTTTTVDLTASYVTRNAAALASVALVLIVGLFVVQVVGAVIRQQPGGLVRAVAGAATAVLGTAAAAAITQSLLVAVDAICDGIAAMAGTTIQDAARQLLNINSLLQLTGAGAGGAALMIVFGLLFIIGATLTLGTLLVRNALIVVAVVVAPLAFAGGVSKVTSGWVRRWAQVTLALILSKLAIVIVFVVAIGMLGDARGIGALLAGLILLLLAVLAPWACFKVLDFAGTQIASEWHRSTNGSTLASLHQGRVSAQSMMRTVAPLLGAGATGGAAGVTAGSRAGTPSSAGKGTGGSAPAAPRPPAAPVPPAASVGGHDGTRQSGDGRPPDSPSTLPRHDAGAAPTAGGTR